MGAPALIPDELAQFLTVYGEHFNIRRACREIGRARSSVYHALGTNPEFKAAFDALRRNMADDLLAEAYRRAHDGVEKPVFGALGNNEGSGEIGRVTEYSDSVLIKMLSALRPEFRAQVDVTNSDGSLQLTETQIMGRLESLLALARARRDRGEVIDAEIVEVPALPKPEDLL
jgi:hypothetical protein